MAYVVLARKYRPQTFADVVGQEVVTQVLTGALAEQRLGHAYLFSGPRGTGKTTIARILAKCLNCEEGTSATPCGKCERCQGADDGAEVDIIELDAASHTGVDTIRELRDEVAYAPMRARHKVYIIDEVHMLSKGAFNALLKTLEEPPAHVVFLFATTEPHKVLDTVLSRCQVLRLRPLTEAEISSRLETVFVAEEVEPGPGVVQELARGAAGGMRDALSLADKLLALSGRTPTLEDLARLGGDGGAREIEGLLARIEAGDRAELLAALDGFMGAESELVDALLERLRQSLLLAHCGAETPLVTGGEEERRSALERGERLSGERIELWMQELLRARERMRLLAGRERIVLELTLLDLCRSENTMGLAELGARIESLTAAIGSGGDVTIRPAPARPKPAPRASGGGVASGAIAPTPRSESRAKPTDPTPADAAPKAPAPPRERTETSVSASWRPFLKELGKTQGALARLLQDKGALEADGAKFVIRVGSLAADESKLVAGRRSQGACARALSVIVGRTVEVELLGGSPGDAESKRPAAARDDGGKRGPAPAQDKFTQEVADLFGGVIEEL